MQMEIENFQEESDELIIKPVGAGQEVGRSCIHMTFKGKKIILDCGIHPGYSKTECLPFLDAINNIEDTDLILISHFHLDHCGALPHLLLKTGLHSKCYMTHATKAIYRYILADYIRVSNNINGNTLYSERDIVDSMNKIETVDFHQEIEYNGIKFIAYHAGHVLGAAMFQIEIAGVKVLYTGDFSRQEDRHLMSAEMPPCRPDVLITEATYGTHIHDKREDRETRFTGLVHNIVGRGGRCLIPVFALGRAQELMLILDEYWAANPSLHRIPIYYASQLARKCISIYQTYLHAMNDRVRKQLTANHNPFVFKHISNMKSIEHFDSSLPCVVLASPGMMQSGLSRELFENWCTDTRNGVIVAGYCVEGTLAKEILSAPAQVQTMNGQSLPLKCSVDYISFSAHTDYQQTSEFIRQLRPSHVVLVHGEKNNMMKLSGALQREYENEDGIDISTPKNCEPVILRFRGEKTAKIIGRLAADLSAAVDGKVRGILVKKNFSYQIMSPDDLPLYTDLRRSELQQKISIVFKLEPQQLLDRLQYFSKGSVKILLSCGISRSGEKHVWRVFGTIDVTFQSGLVTIEWQTSPGNDMYADAVQAIVLNANINGYPGQVIPQLAIMTPDRFQSCVLNTLDDMFGAECIVPGEPNDQQGIIKMAIDDKNISIDCNSLTVNCPDDKQIESIILGTIQRLYSCLMPIE